MSNEAVRIKKKKRYCQPDLYLPCACTGGNSVCRSIYLAGVIIFEDWRKYL